MLLNEISNRGQEKRFACGNIPIVKAQRGMNIKQVMKQLGQGMQTAAFSHPKRGDVTRLTRMAKLEDPAIEFLCVCLEHASNPYLPTFTQAKIYDLTEVEGVRPTEKYIMISHMEKLEETPRGWLPKEFGEIVPKSTGLFDIAIYDYNFSSFEQMSDLDSLFFTDGAIETIIEKSPDKNLVSALKALYPLMEKYGVDLHAGNMMLRGKQLVLMDPIPG